MIQRHRRERKATVNNNGAKTNQSKENDYVVVEITSVTLYNLLKPLKIRKIKNMLKPMSKQLALFLGASSTQREFCETGSTKRVCCSNKNLKLMRYV